MHWIGGHGNSVADERFFEEKHCWDLGLEQNRVVKLHDLRDLLELFLQTWQRAGDRLHSEGRSAGVLGGDAVAASSKEAADQIGGLPGVEARLHQVFTQTGEIGFGKSFDMGVLGLCHLLLLFPSSPAVPALAWIVRRSKKPSRFCTFKQNALSALFDTWTKDSTKKPDSKFQNLVMAEICYRARSASRTGIPSTMG